MKKGMRVAERYVVLVAAVATGVVGVADHALGAGYDLLTADTIAGSGAMIVGMSNILTGTLHANPDVSNGKIDYSNFRLLINGSQVAISTSGNNVSLTTLTYNTSSLSAGSYVFDTSASVTSHSGGGGAATLVTHTTDSLTIYNHADAQLVAGSFSPVYSNGSGDANYTPVAPTQTLSNANHTINIDYGTIWATPGDDPYPVLAYFDITNPLATAVTVALSAVSGGVTVTPAGTSPTWALQAADGSAFNLATLAGGGVYHARVLFNSNDPTLYLPGSPFSAAWDISLTEDSTVIGHSTTAQVLHVNATAIAVPTPVSALTGLGLLGGLGVKRVIRSRRERSEQLA